MTGPRHSSGPDLWILASRAPGADWQEEGRFADAWMAGAARIPAEICAPGREFRVTRATAEIIHLKGRRHAR